MWFDLIAALARPERVVRVPNLMMGGQRAGLIISPGSAELAGVGMTRRGKVMRSVRRG